MYAKSTFRMIGSFMNKLFCLQCPNIREKTNIFSQSVCWKKWVKTFCSSWPRLHIELKLSQVGCLNFLWFNESNKHIPRSSLPTLPSWTLPLFKTPYSTIRFYLHLEPANYKSIDNRPLLHLLGSVRLWWQHQQGIGLQHAQKPTAHLAPCSCCYGDGIVSSPGELGSLELRSRVESDVWSYLWHKVMGNDWINNESVSGDTIVVYFENYCYKNR